MFPPSLSLPVSRPRFGSIEAMRHLMYERIRPELEKPLFKNDYGQLTGIQLLHALADYQTEQNKPLHQPVHTHTFLSTAAHPEDHGALREALNKLSELGVLQQNPDRYSSSNFNYTFSALGQAILEFVPKDPSPPRRGLLLK